MQLLGYPSSISWVKCHIENSLIVLDSYNAQCINENGQKENGQKEYNLVIPDFVGQINEDSCMSLYNVTGKLSIQYKGDSISSLKGFLKTTNRDLKEIDLSEFDMQSIEQLEDLFLGSKFLLKITLPSGVFNKVNNTRGMFSGCESLKEIQFNGWKIPNVEDLGSMFRHCKKLKGLDNIDFLCGGRKVRYLDSFIAESTIEYLDLSEIYSENPVQIGALCLKNQQIKRLKTGRLQEFGVVSMQYMCAHCIKLRYIDLQETVVVDTSNRKWFMNLGITQNMQSTFEQCRQLEILKLPRELHIAGTVAYTFLNCENLKVLDLQTVDMSGIGGLICTFQGVAAEQIKIENKDLQRLRQLDNTFQLSKAKIISLRGQNLNNIERIQQIYLECNKLETLDFRDTVINKEAKVFKCTVDISKLEILVQHDNFVQVSDMIRILLYNKQSDIEITYRVYSDDVEVYRRVQVIPMQNI